MRSMEMSAKTVEAAVQAACEALGVDRDDINVSYEVLEFPTRKLFKNHPRQGPREGRGARGGKAG